MVEKSEIREQVKMQIMEVLEDSEWEGEVNFFDTFYPIGGLGPYFDSLNAVEVAVGLSAKFGCEIGYNCFYSDEEKRGLNIKEITDKVHRLVNNLTE
jgi:acyl carrier protein